MVLKHPLCHAKLMLLLFLFFHRYMQLGNGLKVLLVTDPLTEKAAAALSVRVGQF